VMELFFLFASKFSYCEFFFEFSVQCCEVIEIHCVQKKTPTYVFEVNCL